MGSVSTADKPCQPPHWDGLPPCLLAGSRTARHHPPGNTEQQQSAASPSSPVSTAGDSRSSKRTGLPPCQQKLPPLLAVLVHSTVAGESLAVTTKHWQQPSRLERRSCRGREGGERVCSPRLCSWAHLWINVTPPSAPPSQPAFLFSLTFCYDLIVSCVAPPPSPPFSCTRANQRLEQHTPLHPHHLLVSRVNSSLLLCPHAAPSPWNSESEQRDGLRPDFWDIMTRNPSASSIHEL